MIAFRDFRFRLICVPSKPQVTAYVISNWKSYSSYLIDDTDLEVELEHVPSISGVDACSLCILCMVFYLQIVTFPIHTLYFVDNSECLGLN